MSDYPWLDAGRTQLARLSANMPHALLLHGAPGVAKHALAIELVAALLCDQAQLEQGRLHACGQCRNCTMFVAGNHPDFHFISSEFFVDSGEEDDLGYALRYLEAPEKRSKRKPRKVILVDQVRALIDTFSLSNHSAGRKVALIEPAEAMNVNAANALLKLLEEPASNSVLILVSNDISRLPMTIRSRCISLSINPPDELQALEWLAGQGVTAENALKALAISSGAPLLALKYIRGDDIANFETMLDALAALAQGGAGAVETREKIVSLESPGVIVSWLQRILGWMIATVQQGGVREPRTRPAYQRQVSRLVGNPGGGVLPAMFSLYDDLLEIRKQDTEVVDFALLLDKWLIAFERRLKTQTVSARV